MSDGAGPHALTLQTERQTELRSDSTSRDGAQLRFDTCHMGPRTYMRGPEHLPAASPTSNSRLPQLEARTRFVICTEVQLWFDMCDRAQLPFDSRGRAQR